MGSRVAWEAEEESASAPSRSELWAGSSEGSAQVYEVRKSELHEVAPLPLLGEQAESEESVAIVDADNAPLGCTSEASPSTSCASASSPAGHRKAEVAPQA